MTLTEQLPLIPEQPPTMGAVEDVQTDRLPPDEGLVGEAPSHELVDSIRRWGVLEPLLVRAVGGGLDYGDPLRFVSGRRRLKAVRALAREARETVRRLSATVPPDTLLNDETVPGYRHAYETMVRWTRVPVRVISDPEGTDADGRTDALAVTSNAVRRANPASEFLALVRLRNRFVEAGLSERQALTEASRATGLATGTVKQRLRLVDLNADLLDEFLAGHLAYSVALECARLGPGTQATIASATDAGERLTLEKVRQIRQGEARAHQQVLFDKLPPADLRKLGGGTPPVLAVRAQEAIEALRSTRLPVCIEAAGLLSEYIEFENDWRTDAENRSLND